MKRSFFLLEDSDFVAKGSGTDDELEYDSDAKINEEMEGGTVKEEEEISEDETRARKRTKPQTKSKPAKKKKEVRLHWKIMLL